ncbi:MAG: YbaB/EbfC family nucleoid-associated protein [Mollicutes bacterium]|nr:YbaB/EbfC family nucleoid-associated protein [Mollicutes bacterium]
MNMQNILKQAQKIQKEMMEEKKKIDETIFSEKTSLVSVEMKGNKELVSVKILADDLTNDDIEMLEDMIMVAINNVIRKIDEETEKKLGKFTQGMPGLF